MPRLAPSGHPQPQRHLLRDFDAEHRLLAVPGPAATFVQQEADILEQLRPVVYQPTRTIRTTGFFIGGCHEDHIAAQPGARCMQRKERLQLHDGRTFHITRATAVDVSLPDFAREWWHGPVARVCRDYVDMIEQYQRRFAPPVQARPDVAAPRRRLSGFVGNTRRIEDRGEIFDAARFVARRVGRVDLDVLDQACDRIRRVVLCRGGRGSGTAQYQ